MFGKLIAYHKDGPLILRWQWRNRTPSSALNLVLLGPKGPVNFHRRLAAADGETGDENARGELRGHRMPASHSCEPLLAPL
jgi:hypothetical protein